MSTDDPDQPPTDLEEAFPRVAALEQQLRERGLDLDDLPQQQGTTRREILKAAGLAGTAGIVGAGGMNAATQEAQAGSQSTGQFGEAGNPADVVAEDIYGPGGQGSGDAVAFEAANIEELNNVHVVPQDTADIGQVLNDFDANLPEGSVIYTPPGNYPLSTTYTPSKRMVWLGDHAETNYATETGVTITRQSDIPIIDGGDNIGLAIRGVRFGESGDYPSTAIQIRGSSWLERVTGSGFGGDFCHFDQTEGSNINSTTVSGMEIHDITGDGVKVSSPGSVTNVNAMRIHIADATAVGGYVVNKPVGFGDRVEVTHAESIGGGTGNVFYIGTSNSHYRNVYSEGVGTLFEFANDYNCAEHTFVESSVSNIHNGSNDNLVLNRGAPSNGPVMDRTFGRLDMGSPFQIDDLRMQSNAWRVYENASGRWVFQDNANNRDVMAYDPSEDRTYIRDASGSLRYMDGTGSWV